MDKEACDSTFERLIVNNYYYLERQRNNYDGYGEREHLVVDPNVDPGTCGSASFSGLAFLQTPSGHAIIAGLMLQRWWKSSNKNQDIWCSRATSGRLGGGLGITGGGPRCREDVCAPPSPADLFDNTIATPTNSSLPAQQEVVHLISDGQPTSVVVAHERPAADTAPSIVGGLMYRGSADSSFFGSYIYLHNSVVWAAVESPLGSRHYAPTQITRVMCSSTSPFPCRGDNIPWDSGLHDQVTDNWNMVNVR
ncbi:unnamed protein product [Miscanthus lutarioriparius]|uniref:Uncharacterized protein n=1 Tax=Miscanthus lutarioriparius TaxID=422564 RepID=A0A811R9Y5_9POAL|nr:unnamed protein product [Miscanthus lutarioriparius]